MSKVSRHSLLAVLQAAILLSLGLLVWTPDLVDANGTDSGNFKTKYPFTKDTRLDPNWVTQNCAVCHKGPPVLNPYGVDYQGAGGHNMIPNQEVSLAALGTIEPKDSDKDGWSNIVEIQALFSPGNAADEPAAGLTLTPSTDAKSAAPWATVTYTLTVTNTGQATDTFDVTSSNT